MILKKYTAITFLTLASMIMLVFVVVPHHHHQEYICFNALHCDNSSTTAPHSHDDSPFSDEGRCVKNLFQTQISRIQSLAHNCADGHCHHFIQTLFFTSDILSLRFSEAEQIVLPPIFYSERLHSTYFISDLAGRAPPYFG